MYTVICGGGQGDALFVECDQTWLTSGLSVLISTSQIFLMGSVLKYGVGVVVVVVGWGWGGVR